MTRRSPLGSVFVARLAMPLAIVLVMAACSMGTDVASSSESPSASASRFSVAPTESPSPSPSPLPSPTSAVGTLPHDSVAQVVTTDLVVRSSPGVQPGSEIYPERLNDPMLVFVLDGPVPADGYDWYLVEPFQLHVCMDICGEEPPFGWVAQAGKDGEPWIAPRTIDCPRADAESIGWLSGTARLACFGGEALTLLGSMGGCFAAETPIAWQQSGCQLRPPDYVPRDTFESFLQMYLAQGVQWPTAREGTNIRVTGHFDDPAAESCAALASPAPDFGLRPVPAELAVLYCRGAFVVTEVESAAQ